MTRRIALLRGVNVGGTGLLPMAELRRVAEGLGWGGPTTLLQSGNLVFEGGDAPDSALEARLQAALKDQLGLVTEIFVRDGARWAALMADNPMRAEAEKAPSAFLVTVLKGPAPEAALVPLRAACVDGERVEARGEAIYASCPGGIGRSRMAAGLSGKKAGFLGTGRNWNTIRKLADMVGLEGA